MVDGQKYDTEKVKLYLIPAEAIFAWGRILTFGAKKYAERNWEKGILYSRVFGAVLRHLFAWWGGENLDPETSESHLSHALTDIGFLIAYEERGMIDWDDRPKHGETFKLGVWKPSPTIQLSEKKVTYGEDDSVGKLMVREALAARGQCDPRTDGSGGAA